MQRIVVGIDGSPGSVAALKWAIGEAWLRSAAVEAVHAFHVPYGGGSAIMPIMLDPDEFRAGAEAELAKIVATVDQTGVPEPVRQTVVEGPASSVLIAAGKGAAMVVVGARGHGGLSGMLLGSVSRQVSEHCTVPVVIVPKEEAGS